MAKDSIKSMEPVDKIETFELPKGSKSAELTLEQLQRSSVAKHDSVAPNGIVHYHLLETLLKSTPDALNPVIDKIIVADGGNKNALGIETNDALEDQYGEKALIATTFRRVFFIINFLSSETDEFKTSLVIDYNQKGITMAIGQQIKLCSNLCIYGIEDVISTFGSNKVKLINLFEIYESWMSKYDEKETLQRGFIKQLKETTVNSDDALRFIGHLSLLRVLKDTKNKKVRIKDIYPLNGSQITSFCENYAIEEHKNKIQTLYDLHNVGTNLLKANSMETVNIIDQSLRFSEVFKNFFALN